MTKVRRTQSWNCGSLDYSVAEFFAGIGLMRLGLEEAGWNVAFANDIDDDKFQMYRGHFGSMSESFVVGDIHSLKASSIPEVSLATASFPCNDLSLAGMRRGLVGKQSSAFWGFISLLEEMNDKRPPIILLENVSGFLTSHQGKDFESALKALNKLGYQVDAIMLDAERFVPQSRVRLFVIAKIRVQDERLKIKETPGFYQSSVRSRALSDFILTHPDIDWSLRELPEPPYRTISLNDIIEPIEDNSDIWWDVGRKNYLCNQMSEKHALMLKELSEKQKWSYATVFRRVRNGRSMAEMRWDGIAGCLRTPRGGSGRQILMKLGYRRVHVRLLTPRECARLMGADDFVIQTSPNKALFGFGDAVCVPVVTWIANNYLNPLLKELSAPSKGVIPRAI